MRATEFIVETAMMGKIADSGKIIRILKKAHTVPFSDEKNWLLVDTDPGKGNSGLGIKWIPADTRFEWVRPYRDTVEQGVAESDLDKYKKYIRPVVKTTPKIEKDNNPSGRTNDHIEWKVTSPTGEIHRYSSKKQAQDHFDSFGPKGVAEGSEWETRHNEFVTVGNRATLEQINKIVKALVGAAQQAGSKRGFLNQLVGKQSNGDLARMAHGAETLVKNIQKNSNAKPGSDERKELGQQLVYAVSLLKRISGEQGVAEGSLNEIYKMPPTKDSSQGMTTWAYNDAVEKKSPVLYRDSNVIIFKANEDLLRYIILQDGNPVLYIGLSKFLDGYKSGTVATEVAGRGKGLAQKAYLNVSDILGVPIYSDTTQTDASRLGIWDKLIQQYPERIVGYDQKTNKNLPLSMTDKGPVVNQNQPIYVDRNKKDTTKPIAPNQRYRTRVLKLLPIKQGVAEGQDDKAEAYRAHLIKTLPQIMKLFANIGKGWIPSKEQMLSAVDTAYIVMKHTGDVKQAGKVLMDELNTLYRMSQGKSGEAEGLK